MALIYEKMIKENKPAFIAKLQEISARLGFNPNWLMAIFRFESGVDHRIVNSIGCVGLIQFCGSTQKGLNVTADQLKSMSNVEQLEYVYRYFLPGKKYISSFTDLYLYTFFPVALTTKKPDSYVFPDWAYKANKPLDTNGDGIITLGEWKTRLRNLLRKDVVAKKITQSDYDLLFPASYFKPVLSMIGIFAVLYTTYYLFSNRL